MTSAEKKAYLQELIRQAGAETRKLALKFSETQGQNPTQDQMLMEEFRCLTQRVDEAQAELRKLIADDLQGASLHHEFKQSA